MNNKFLKRTNTAIELTSLLDVIFIVLMVVICNQNNEATKAIEAAQNSVIEAEASMEKASEMIMKAEAAMTENAMLQEQLELCTDIFSQVTLITIKLTYTPENPRQRMISVKLNDNEIEKMTMLTPAEPQKGFDELTEYLTGILEEADGRPVILSVDRSQILYRDEETLTKIVNDFKEFNNIYMRNESNE